MKGKNKNWPSRSGSHAYLNSLAHILMEWECEASRWSLVTVYNGLSWTNRILNSFS